MGKFEPAHPAVGSFGEATIQGQKPAQSDKAEMLPPTPPAFHGILGAGNQSVIKNINQRNFDPAAIAAGANSHLVITDQGKPINGMQGGNAAPINDAEQHAFNRHRGTATIGPRVYIDTQAAETIDKAREGFRSAAPVEATGTGVPHPAQLHDRQERDRQVHISINETVFVRDRIAIVSQCLNGHPAWREKLEDKFTELQKEFKRARGDRKTVVEALRKWDGAVEALRKKIEERKENKDEPGGGGSDMAVLFIPTSDGALPGEGTPEAIMPDATNGIYAGSGAGLDQSQSIFAGQWLGGGGEIDQGIAGCENSRLQLDRIQDNGNDHKFDGVGRLIYDAIIDSKKSKNNSQLLQVLTGLRRTDDRTNGLSDADLRIALENQVAKINKMTGSAAGVKIGVDDDSIHIWTSGVGDTAIPYNPDTDRRFVPDFCTPDEKNKDRQKYLENLGADDPNLMKSHKNALEKLTTPALAIMDALSRGDGFALRSAIYGIDPKDLQTHLHAITTLFTASTGIGVVPDAFSVTWSRSGDALRLGSPPIYIGAP